MGRPGPDATVVRWYSQRSPGGPGPFSYISYSVIRYQGGSQYLAAIRDALDRIVQSIITLRARVARRVARTPDIHRACQGPIAPIATFASPREQP